MIMDAGRLGSPFGMARSGHESVESVTLQGSDMLESLEASGLSLGSLCPGGMRHGSQGPSTDAGLPILASPVLEWY